MQRQQLNLEESLLQSENKNHCEGRCRKDRTSHKNKCRRRIIFRRPSLSERRPDKEPPRIAPNMTEDVIHPIKEAFTCQTPIML